MSNRENVAWGWPRARLTDERTSPRRAISIAVGTSLIVPGKQREGTPQIEKLCFSNDQLTDGRYLKRKMPEMSIETLKETLKEMSG
jgi:hypothetical protein